MKYTCNIGCMGQMSKFGLVLLVLSLSMMEGKEYEKPLNCGHLECAPCSVIQSESEFEIRSYSKAMWAATTPIASPSYKDAVSKGFKILFAYIQANNDQAVKINMTAPVLVNVHPNPMAEADQNLSYVVHFYMPQIFQTNPPQSDEAHPVELPQHKFAAVRRFGGFMDDANIAAEISALKESLKGTAWDKSSAPPAADEHSGHSLLYSVAGYNSPYEYDNRVNEVMLWFD